MNLLYRADRDSRFNRARLYIVVYARLAVVRRSKKYGTVS